ncbi:SMP-30/gluconolactonase/LRE family protein [Aestuariivivens sp. NBU2969]|uniref:SMP-30/gluconolactonase/LRE family protein n=1 Tax=Aestuariivivens sp. NBU2969 TaxID=2873267 RepID=UPI001CC00B06|nr:SMP-30/gluconolactonase/LRE family protein [Aestuariivivens sp. NBU2969]
METIKADLIYPISAIVGEGSLWDDDNQQLLWVDILDHKIYAFNPKTGSNTGYDLGQDIGTVVITESGLWAYADQDGIGYFDSKTGHKIDGPKPELNHPEIRFNDGKCDPRGTFWAGTMAYDCRVGAGVLYEFDAMGNTIEKIKNTTISNGLVWSMDGSKFYFIDSLTYEVHQYDYDLKTGHIKNKKVVAVVDKEIGLPDGMAIDTEDHLWVALYGGGKVIRINPETGAVVFEVILPVPYITSCVFGGENLDELYITSASYSMSKEQLEEYPLSGSLFKVKVPFKGILPNKMKDNLKQSNT